MNEHQDLDAAYLKLLEAVSASRPAQASDYATGVALDVALRSVIDRAAEKVGASAVIAYILMLL
jgi:hypothetical protein